MEKFVAEKGADVFFAQIFPHSQGWNSFYLVSYFIFTPDFGKITFVDS